MNLPRVTLLLGNPGDSDVKPMLSFVLQAALPGGPLKRPMRGLGVQTSLEVPTTHPSARPSATFRHMWSESQGKR